MRNWLAIRAGPAEVVTYAVGGILLVAGVSQLAVHPSAGWRLLVDAMFLVGLPLVVIGVATEVTGSDLPHADYRRVIRWTMAGAIAVAFIASTYVVDDLLRGEPLASVTFTLLLGTDLGAAFGSLVGRNEARVAVSVRRTERAELGVEFAQEQNETFAFLNRLLRHQILNGMNVVLGHVNLLQDEVDTTEGRRHLQVVHNRGTRMIEHVQSIRDVMRTISGEVPPTPVNLSQVLEAEIESAALSHPDAEFVSRIPPAVCVRGSPLLWSVFANLFENAIIHNVDDHPRVEVLVEPGQSSVRVEILDDGPGVPDELKTAYFRRGEHGAESLGEGLGLYLAETVVEDCGGRIWIEDAEPTGACVVVELPRLAEDQPAEAQPEPNGRTAGRSADPEVSSP